MEYKKGMFASSRLSDYMAHTASECRNEIASLDPDTVLNAAKGELERLFLERYSLVVPALDEEGMFADSQEADVEIARGWRHDGHMSHLDRPITKRGLSISVSIPFVGDGRFFGLQASKYTPSGTPTGEVREEILTLTYKTTERDPKAIEQMWRHDVQRVKEQLGWISSDVAIFNANLPMLIGDTLAARRKKIQEDHAITEGIGLPIKRRQDVPKTYAAPVRRSSLSIPRAPVQTRRPEPLEPTLPTAEYEGILEICQNIALAMERSPATFSRLGEEGIRDHFLIHLNGQYEGQATGETFNAGGKTDILVRIQNRNIFIGECKFWSGPKGFIEAIDQLLSYTNWRDTKTAILLFNKNRGLTAILKQIPGIVMGHKNYIGTSKTKSEKLRGETVSCYTLSNPNDAEKHLSLAVMVFDIPSPMKKAA